MEKTNKKQLAAICPECFRIAVKLEVTNDSGELEDNSMTTGTLMDKCQEFRVLCLAENVSANEGVKKLIYEAVERGAVGRSKKKEVSYRGRR